MSLKYFKEFILNNLTGTLRQRQFKKIGNIFSYTNGDLIYQVELQSSQSSTVDLLKVTLNVEIISKPLCKVQDGFFTRKDSCHYTKRIGHYLPQSQDKWWSIQNLSDANAAPEEMNSIIVNHILPEFKILNSTSDLANLWRQGRCPGLTETQRKEYLLLLEEPSV